MAYETPGFVTSIDAAADLSSSQFRVLQMTSTGVTVATADTGQSFVGVLQNKPTAGRASTVMCSGISRCVASGAIAKGARVTATTGGKVTSTGIAAGDMIIGIALEAATADNDIIPVLLQIISV